MNGRLEHGLKINETINYILKDKPVEVGRFYYKIRATKEPTTCLEYVRKVNTFLDTINKDVHDITVSDLDDYFSKLLYITDSNGIEKRSSNAYRQSIYSALNAFFSFLYTRGEIKTNPMNEIERTKNKDHVSRIALDLDEFNRILQSVQDGVGSKGNKQRYRYLVNRDLLILFLFMNTGMRRTALSEINVQNVDLENKTITVIDKRNKLLEYNITPELEKIIYNWLNDRKVLLSGRNEDALFITDKGNRISDKAIYNLVKKYSKDALGYAISPHKLRASFVTIFYEACGHDIKATSEAVGHSNIATTSLYIVNKNNSRKKAANFMSSNLKI